MTYPPEKTPVATALGPATARSAYRLPRPAGVEPRWHHLAGPSCRQLGASLALALSLASVGWADDTPLTTPATAPGATGTVTIRLQLSPSSPDGESTSSAKTNTAETSTAQPSTAQLSTAQPPAETPSEKKSPEKKSPEKTPAAVAAESAPQLPGGALELTPQPRLRTADRRPRLTPGAPEAGKLPVGVLPTATEPSARPAPSRQLELEAKRSSDESPVENVLRLGSEAERRPRPNMRGQSVELELSLEAPAAGGKAD
ncbi:MAG: hypothetical protein KDA45_15470, partial [Planctomycetales bacterium]|nr:hypothetical protein [Planctomycetales bacterium]